MTTRGIADVVFCIDASQSMQPCIDGVRANLSAFVEGLKADRQIDWDLRMDFVAHCAAEAGLGTAFRHRTLYHDECFQALYSAAQSQDRFFTTDASEFKDGLARISVQGDEAPLVGLDFALDFPWRGAAQCHRIIIMLTDEPLEQGVAVEWQKSKLSEIIDKIHALRVMLFLVAPESDGFSTLCEADRSEYQVVPVLGDGLHSVDFRNVLNYIGKSVSKSNAGPPPASAVAKGLFGQASWGTTQVEFRGK